MNNYAGGKVTAFPSQPSPLSPNFHYDGVKQLNRLNVNCVSMNPSPVSEIFISQKKKKKKSINK